MSEPTSFIESNILLATISESYSEADRLLAGMTDRELRELHIAVMRLDLSIDVETDRRRKAKAAA